MFVITENQLHTWTLRQETDSIRIGQMKSLPAFFVKKNENQAPALGDYEKNIYRTLVS